MKKSKSKEKVPNARQVGLMKKTNLKKSHAKLPLIDPPGGSGSKATGQRDGDAYRIKMDEDDNTLMFSLYEGYSNFKNIEGWKGQGHEIVIAFNSYGMG